MTTTMLQIFVDIIIRPRKVFADIGSRHLFPSYAILVMAGIAKAFHESYKQVFDVSHPTFHPWLMMSGVVVLVCLSLLVGAMFWATLLNASSALFNPYDEWPQLRVAVPFGLFPAIISDVMAMILGPGWVTVGIQIACLLWALALYIIMLASIKNIHPFKAFLSILIAALFVVAVIALIGFLIYLIFSSGR